MTQKLEYHLPNIEQNIFLHICMFIGRDHAGKDK